MKKVVGKHVKMAEARSAHVGRNQRDIVADES